MSAITSLVDKTPVMPQSMIEWKEFIEYSLSITFSFLTGILLGTISFFKQSKLKEMIDANTTRKEALEALYGDLKAFWDHFKMSTSISSTIKPWFLQSLADWLFRLILMSFLQFFFQAAILDLFRFMGLSTMLPSVALSLCIYRQVLFLKKVFLFLSSKKLWIL